MSTLTTSPSSGVDARAARGHDPAGRARADRRHRASADRVGRGDSSGRGGDQQLADVAGVAQALLEPSEVADDGWPDVRVHERGRRPLELGRLRVHLVGERDQLDVRVLLEHDLASAQLVHRVEVGVEEHDRDRRDRRTPAGDAVACAPPPRRAASRPRPRPSSARRSRAGPAAARSARAAEGRVPDVLLVAAAHLDLVAESLGDEQPGRRARHLDHRVVARGRPVHDRRRSAPAPPRSSRGPRRPRACPMPSSTPSDWSLGVVGVFSRTTVPSERRQHAVGERPADVDADPVRQRRSGVHRAARRSARSASVASWSRARVMSSSEPVMTTP